MLATAGVVKQIVNIKHNVKYKTPILSIVRNKIAYNGDGRTTVRILNQDTEDDLMIKSYGVFGFRLNNNITVLGPIALFPRSVLSWRVGGAADVTADSLRLFALLEPKPDLIVIGVESRDRKYYDSIFKAARANKLNAEILPTEKAASTFNFLNAEGRSVCAAMIPPLSITSTEDDVFQSKMHYDNLYQNPLSG